MNDQWFAARLKELREAAGLSQKALADRAGLSQRAVSHWEQGIREPGWSNVLALARALGVDCRAFDQKPAPRPETRPGRPAKPTPEPAEPTRKRERRRAREEP
jgi:transcriptional regulator with XRE-family HTH domain